jgi:phosphoribosylformylglycinamidine cyclo-ligase
MPGVYTPPDYDLAGFVVGLVEEQAVIGAERVRSDDVLIAFESTGLHTNGYSLARRIVSERLKLGPDDAFPGTGTTMADALLAVHRSYLPALQPSLGRIHALAHITGGGIPGNLNRALPAALDARVDRASWSVPPLFETLVEAGGVERDEAFRAFNMGVGMIALADRDEAAGIITAAGAAGVRGWIAGDVVAGSGQVRLS